MRIINIILTVLLLSAGINITSAAQELPFKRGIIVNEWGMQFSTKEKIDQVIDNVSYMKADVILMSIGSEYYEAVRDPSKASWDSRASWNMLEYAINKAHSKNIQLHVLFAVNSVGLPARAESKLWGTTYNVINFSGGKDPVRLDAAYKEVQDYETGLLGFISNHYPTLDGIQIEEPFYTTQSYSPPIIARVKEKYNGYDITGNTDYAKPECRGSSIAGTNQSICPTFAKIYDVERDVFNEFFTKIRSSVNANKANPNLLLSANAMNGYRPLHGFDPRYMSDNNLIDWYVAQTATESLSSFKSSIERLNLEVDNIPVVPASYITWSSYYPNANQQFLNEVSKTCEYGGKAEWVFAYAWRYKIVDGKTAYEGLHNLAPSSLCGQSTTVSAPTFSPPAGTYPGSQSVSISTSTTGATIRYTKDNTTPTETSPVYSAPIIISSNTTLKARAWKTSSIPSVVATANYAIGTPVLSSISITPQSASMAVDTTQDFAAISNDQFGNPITMTITWTSSNESVGTITPSGTFTALAEGNTTITAVSGSVTGTASAVVTVSQPDINYIDNLIDNPGFESGTTSWQFWTGGIGTFSASPNGYEGNNSGMLVLNSSYKNIQLYQTGITLEPETHYLLSFAAYSTTGHDLTINMIKHDSPYTNYGLFQTFDLGTNWQTFTTEFNTTGFTSPVDDGRLMFWLAPFAKAGDTYYFDNVKLEKV